MTISTLLPFSSAVLAALLAAAVLLRRHRNIADWAFAVGMFLLALDSFCIGEAARSYSDVAAMSWGRWRLVIHSCLPGVWLLFSLTYARGNAGEFVRKWRILLLGFTALPITIALVYFPVLVGGAELAENGSRWNVILRWPAIVVYLALLVASVTILMNLERTLRASIGIMRWRLKSMLLAVGVLFVVRLYTTSQAILFQSVDLAISSVNSAALLVAAILAIRSLVRTGRFDLDVHPSHTVLQGSLTALLTGIYLVAVGVLAKLAEYFGGDTGFALKAFVILVSVVVLAVLLQSDHVRMHLRRFVSRHFQRPLYDYRTIWRKFTEGTASRVETADLSPPLVRLIADVFQALSVTLWLVDERNETFTLGASTSLTSARSEEVGPQKSETAGIIAHFRENPEPAELEGSDEEWAKALRRWHPSEFPDSGHRVCIPLIGRGDVLGLILIGDRVGGVPFSIQDFDLMKCVGDHMAATLLNVQLSQQLLQTRELEAFQTMATFFVHDLKNAASTLSLMLQNLPVHFDDPAFREDALRGISKSVAHINRLIGRLGLLRRELKVQPVDSSLNDLINEATASLAVGSKAAIEQQLGQLPSIPIDREQMAKVITNLVLNAIEAAPPEGGFVRLQTSVDGDWVVLRVTDNGCGMSPEFLQRSLFRPFQTTKKNGLGIGMFQSRAIVEAHGGRIAVGSDVGKGTTFRIFLPLRRIVRQSSGNSSNPVGTASPLASVSAATRTTHFP